MAVMKDSRLGPLSQSIEWCFDVRPKKCRTERTADPVTFPGGKPASKPSFIAAELVDSSQQAHLVRMLRLATLGLVAEMIVFAVGFFAPAMKTLLPPVYLLVAVLFAGAIWHQFSRRPGRERRRPGSGDRRHGDRRES
ncbi:MAG TPA: hypothetical protein VGM67_03580 [Gemmatimonadaceae bacterium]|jgi:hypothetical protein